SRRRGCFFRAEDGIRGRNVTGVQTCALPISVRVDWQGSGIGRALLEALLAEARAYGLAEVLALTRKPTFFQKLGFVTAEREHFPLKVWADCARCPRQNCCDEIAVVLRL